ncbi:MAG: hypothetical protein NT038_03835 [Euryarchaeota archaeon]|nr:hypothetical protein [Euryarchaeota archaeon]
MDTTNNLSENQSMQPKQSTDVDPYVPLVQKTSRPLIAGVLLLLSGLLGILNGINYLTLDQSTIDSIMIYMQSMNLPMTITEETLRQIYTLCGTTFIILSIFTILGGVVSIKRKLWGLALTGSILGLFTIGYPPFSSTILAFIALIILILARKEFQSANSDTGRINT